MDKNLSTSGGSSITSESAQKRYRARFFRIQRYPPCPLPLPECDLSRIDLSNEVPGHRVCSPLFIAAMTGGHPGTKRSIAALPGTERYGLGMCVGSQRAALEDPALKESFRVVREKRRMHSSRQTGSCTAS
jgi:isopentenyl diphosphate isomerase/L-lactate dehydrogenase-like FMN-dependent dehydrogenase